MNEKISTYQDRKGLKLQYPDRFDSAAMEGHLRDSLHYLYDNPLFGWLYTAYGSHFKE